MENKKKLIKSDNQPQNHLSCSEETKTSQTPEFLDWLPIQPEGDSTPIEEIWSELPIEEAGKQIDIQQLEASYISKEKLVLEQRILLAKYTKNETILQKIKYDNAKTVLHALLDNPHLTKDIRTVVIKRMDNIAENRERRRLYEQQNNKGCLGIGILLIMSTIYLLISFL